MLLRALFLVLAIMALLSLLVRLVYHLLPRAIQEKLVPRIRKRK
jgi:hypothetical protein